MPSRRRQSAPPGGGKTKTAQNPLLEARARLEEAERLRQARQLDRAQKLCESILGRYPDYVGALHTLGLVLADKRDYRQALAPLVQAAMLNPKDWKTLTALSGVYLRLGAHVMAARTLEQAAERKPDEPGILTTLGEIYREQYEYAAGAGAFRKAISLDPRLHAARMGLGLCATHLGELEEAAAAFERLLEEGERSISLLYALSELPAAFIHSDLLALIDEAVPGQGGDKGEFADTVTFTRAAALDKAGRHEEAWDNLVTANARLHRRHREQCEALRKFEATMLAGARRARIATAPDDLAGRPKITSLFVLGPSRSGKTTLERLLGAHEHIKRGYENPILENAVRQTFQTAGLPTRTRIFELPPPLDPLCREFYFEELAERAGPARVFTNTHPGQITSVLRIAATLPDARFVFVKRDLDDIAIRIFMKKYQSGNAYGYAIPTIREHVGWYYEMIDLLAEKLPDSSLVLRYEDIIDAPDAALNAAAHLCGLAPHDGPLPELGNDRGCGEPYREFMQTAEKV